MWARILGADLQGQVFRALGFYALPAPVLFHLVGQGWGRAWVPVDCGLVTLPFSVSPPLLPQMCGSALQSSG